MNEPELKVVEDSLSEYGYHKTTLGELGPNLPIGIPNGNPPILLKQFDLKSFVMRVERELNELRQRKGGPGTHQGKIVTWTMAHMLTEIGPHQDFAEKKQREKANFVDQMFMVDVLYSYVWLRTQAMSPKLKVDVECDNCSHEWPWTTNLLGAEVLTASEPAQLEKQYRLESPIVIGGKKYDILLLGPPMWTAVSKAKTATKAVGDLKAHIFRQAVKGLFSSEDKNAPPAGLGTGIFDEMTKRDFELAATFVDEAFPGIDLSFEIVCPECERKTVYQTQWNWDFFFGGSSLPTAKSS